MKVKKRHWHLRELRALEKACKHYAPILGSKRDDSTRKDDDQEVKYFGKATHSIDTNTASGIADSSTLGEYYSADATAGMYMIAENDTSFGSDVDASLEWVCTHELSHGLMDYVEEDLRKAAGYWKDANTKTGAGEEPWSGYAKTSLGEDLAESATAYFIKRAAFKTKCPKRFAVIDAAVKAWKAPKRPRRGGAAAAASAAGSAPPRGRCGRRGSRRGPSLSLPEPIEEARALAGSSRADVLARLGASEARSPAASSTARAPASTRPRSPTGRVVFDGDRVAVVYLSGHALRPTKPDDLLAELGDGETLPGAASAGSQLHVYPDQGLAFSHDGPKLEMVEAFPPTTLEHYRATLYRDPPVHHLRTALS